MEIGMVGLGRMGANMVRRLLRSGHRCVVYDRLPQAAQSLAGEGAVAASSVRELVAQLKAPRVVWLMVPAAAVDDAVAEVLRYAARGDIVVDGGNSHYRDDLPRAKRLAAQGLHYVDVGTSGGVWGLDEGYCLMVGGDKTAFAHLGPLLAALAPGVEAAPRTPGRGTPPSEAERGYLHCGPSGAGHFVKMIHNGIEYGMMAALAEGFNLLAHADAGERGTRADAETAPLADPEAYRYELDLAAIAELWRRGSVIRSWLLDLAAHALARDPKLDGFRGAVSDSGEGRWTVMAAIDTAVPVPVLSAALFERFRSRGEGAFADKLLSAMRSEFGGHAEPPHASGADKETG